MVANPEWKWQKFILVRDLGPISEGRLEWRVVLPDSVQGKDLVPVLTDDITIGMVWGMIRRQAKQKFGSNQPKIFFGWLERLGDVMSLEDPSQAIGELWIEVNSESEELEAKP